VLSRSNRNNPVLIDDYGITRQAIVTAIAQKLSAPVRAPRIRVWSLDFGAIVDGASDESDVESRFDAILADVKRSRGRFILFIDEVPALVGPDAVYGPKLANLVERSLVEGSLRLISATRKESYRRLINEKVELQRRLAAIHVGGQSDAADLEKDHEESETEFAVDKLSDELRRVASEGDTAGRTKHVILQVEDTKSAELHELLRENGIEIGAEMARLGALKVELPVDAIAALARSGATRYLSLDKEVRVLGHIERTTGTAEMRSQVHNLGLDGTGIGVAVLDSSIYAEHILFSAKEGYRRVNVNIDFTGKGIDRNDHYGHGTHVAGLLAGSDTRDINLEPYRGIAPNAQLLNLQVLDSKGVGSVSGVLRALDWVLANQARYNIRVANLSLGMPAIDSYRNDPLCRSVRKLVDAGIVVVAAAGNDGKDASGREIYGRIHSPGNEPSAITVGATNTLGTDARLDDNMASYSSRGPTRSYWKDTAGTKHYDNVIKPELVAPGNKLVSAQGKDNYLVEQNPQLDAARTLTDNRDLMYLSGTSMAAPIVSGAAALMLQANPKLTPNMVKLILMYTAQPMKGFNTLQQGVGQLNVEGAVRLARLVRMDENWATASQGTPMLTTSNLPDPATNIAGQRCPWSQGAIMKWITASGTNLIIQYQRVYAPGMALGDGLILQDGTVISDGLVLGDGCVMGDGIIVGDGIILADSVVLGDGLILSDFLMTSDGVIIGDGTVFGDGVVMGDGMVMGDAVMMSDGMVIGDGVVMGDSVAALSTLLNGDDSTSMR
jgi:subtilisin family serine protease